MLENRKVCIIGVWHLGSVFSACLADLGYQVTGVDPDSKRVKDLNSGIPPIFEPGLKELLIANINAGRLKYTTDIRSALKGCNFVMVY